MSLRQLQDRAAGWALACFGRGVVSNPVERAARVLEEAAELAQAAGMSEAFAAELVKYVYGRKIGVIPQELAGVGVTLLVAASARGFDLGEVIEREVERISDPGVMATIRAKQVQKATIGMGLLPIAPK